MSAARPITLALNELRDAAEEIRTSHTVNGEWPASEAKARMDYLQLICLIRNARNEWRDIRQRLLRLNQIESAQDTAA